MAAVKTLTGGQTLLLALPFGLTACTGAITLSGESPYSEMIGQCYELQQPMYVRENICWEIGDLILTPDETRDCLREGVARVAENTHVIIADVRRKRWGSAGFCPQSVVDVDRLDIPEREIFIPLCLSATHISWLQDPVWRLGEELHLRTDYVKPCPESN